MPAPIDPNMMGGGGYFAGQPQQQQQQPVQSLLQLMGGSGGGGSPIGGGGGQQEQQAGLFNMPQQSQIDQAAVDAEYQRLLAQDATGNSQWGSSPRGYLATEVMKNLGLTGQGGDNGFWTQESRGTVSPQTQAGANLASTNNWQLMPPGYRDPNYALRNGRIIDRRLTDPRDYLRSKGVEPGALQVGSGSAMGFPASSGYFNSDWAHYWPGQVDSWEAPERGIRG